MLIGVAFVVDLCSFWNQALATFLTTSTNNAAAAMGFHPSTESVLTFSGALGRLESPFHLGSCKLLNKYLLNPLFGACIGSLDRGVRNLWRTWALSTASVRNLEIAHFWVKEYG